MREGRDRLSGSLQLGFLRFWEYAGAVSVRTKIFGIVLGSTLILSLTFGFQVRQTFQSTLEEKTREQGISIARDVAARATDLILINDLYSLHELLIETTENYGDLEYAFVLDADGHVLAHTFGSEFPSDLLSVNTEAGGDYQSTVELRDQQRSTIWDVAVPILDGEIGMARIGISDRGVLATIADLTLQLVLTITGVLVASLLAATILTWILTQPILRLVRATESIAAGDFAHRVSRWANDEIGDLSLAFNNMAAELSRMEEIREERETLRRQVFQRVIQAQEDERRRIARELHDEISQALTSLIVGLKNLEKRTSGEEALNQINALKSEAGHTLENVHSIAMQLRPPALDDLGFSSAIERFTTEWKGRHKIDTDVLVRLGSKRLPPDVETALYRIIQEAFNNIAKHAKADSVSLLVEKKNGKVSAIVEDNGTGFDFQWAIKNGRLGILGMQERAALLGGELTIESSEFGTSVYISVPASSPKVVDE